MTAVYINTMRLSFQHWHGKTRQEYSRQAIHSSSSSNKSDSHLTPSHNKSYGVTNTAHRIQSLHHAREWMDHGLNPKTVTAFTTPVPVNSSSQSSALSPSGSRNSKWYLRVLTLHAICAEVGWRTGLRRLSRQREKGNLTHSHKLIDYYSA